MNRTTGQIMLLVLAALAPGVLAQTYFFGVGVLLNLLIAMVTAMATEALILTLRQRSVLSALFDGTALVTASLLALALPALVPWWVVVIGTVAAIGIAKHLYGGTGNNLFNPAMVGYAVVILSFPLAMSQWQSPTGTALSFTETLAIKAGAPLTDGITSATPLDSYKFRGASSNAEYWQEQPQGFVLAYAWDWINLAYLAGGLLLWQMRLIRWQAPVTMLLTLTVLAVLFYDDGSSASLGSPLFHLLSGSTMIAAFFILTDPVTSPASLRGQLLFGIGVGALIFLIRAIGAYPDGIAFAILLMNAVSPLIDQTLTYMDQRKPREAQS